jgi:hypothetical protein
VTGVGTPGIVVQAPQFEGVENIVFPSFVMGVPITNVNQWNNTLYVSDTVSRSLACIRSNSAASFTATKSMKPERDIQWNVQYRRNRNRLGLRGFSIRVPQ